MTRGASLARTTFSDLSLSGDGAGREVPKPKAPIVSGRCPAGNAVPSGEAAGRCTSAGAPGRGVATDEGACPAGLAAFASLSGAGKRGAEGFGISFACPNGRERKSAKPERPASRDLSADGCVPAGCDAGAEGLSARGLSAPRSLAFRSGAWRPPPSWPRRPPPRRPEPPDDDCCCVPDGGLGCRPNSQLPRFSSSAGGFTAGSSRPAAARR